MIVAVGGVCGQCEHDVSAPAELNQLVEAGCTIYSMVSEVSFTTNSKQKNT